MCLVVLIGAFAPRFALFLTWLFTDRISRSIDSSLLAFAGFLLVPFTTFFWVVAWAPDRHVSGFGWVLVGLGVLLDIGSWTGGGKVGSSRVSN
jgi:hypothetical protein